MDRGGRIVASYLSRHGCRALSFMKAGIAKVQKMSESSQRNFQHQERKFKIMAALHHWIKSEDIVAFFLSRFGDRSFLDLSTATIATILSERPLPDGSRAVPIPVGSLLRRIQNFNYLDGKPGLSNYARLSREVYEEYKNASIVDLRSLVIQILDITIEDRVERAFQDLCKRFHRLGQRQPLGMAVQ